jgi:hypothetical protein
MANALQNLRCRLRRIFRAGTRRVLTPGDLYRRLSADFRSRRPHDHRACVMPMVVFRRRETRAPNWTTERLSSHCAHCTPVVDAVVRRHAARFDISDFTPLVRESTPEWHALGTISQAD